MRALNAIGALLSLAYPLLILIGFRVLSLPLPAVAASVLAVSVLLFFARRSLRDRLPAVVMAAAAVLVLVTGADVLLRFYPVVINLLFLFSFLSSIKGEDSIIYSFTLLMYHEMDYASYSHKVRRYCRKLCYVWSSFFALNSILLLFLMLRADLGRWAFYTGFLQYLVMGLLFLGEFLVRLRVDKRNTEAVSLPDLSSDSREKDRIIAYSGRFGDGGHKTWEDYLEETAKVRAFLSKEAIDGVIALSEDFWKTLVVLSASLEMDTEAIFTPNRSSGFLDEVRAGKKTVTIDDASYDGILQSTPLPGDISLPRVSPDAKVTLYTSGSTGKPKRVTHTIAALSRDNGTLTGQWRKDFRWRTVVSTVSPCHIFGLLYAVIRPFQNGIPIRRERAEYPEDFMALGDGKLLIVTSPQYLVMAARTVDKLPLRDPRIVTSGGPLRPDTALEAEKVFGSRPIEVYGSTETGGIAWRKADEAWTVSPDASLSLSADGCLVVTCSYFPGPFKTNDLARLDDGGFKLEGRKDSIVKLSEKRIDLGEVEARLLETGLVEDCSVVVLDGGYRTYLGAAVVPGPGLSGLSVNERIMLLRSRLSQFLEPVAVPRRWRFVENMERSSMGKAERDAVVALFSKEAE